MRTTALALTLSACAGSCDDDTREARMAPPERAAPASSARRTATARPAPEATTVPHAPSAPPPLAALDVPGFGPAVVAAPSGGAQDPTLVVALHGNFDRPEWQCEAWRRITGGSAFVLCPRGSPRSDSPPGDRRYTFDSLDRARRELAAARERFDAAYPEASERHVVLTGFSLGGVYAAHLATAQGGPYTHLVLVEGGDRAWTRKSAHALAERGGRVLVACTAAWCRQRFGRIRPWFGDAMRIVRVDDAGHTYTGPVAEALAEAWSFARGAETSRR